MLKLVAACAFALIGSTSLLQVTQDRFKGMTVAKYSGQGDFVATRSG